jgi:tetratricopeptide (TPR) repeat protein
MRRALRRSAVVLLVLPGVVLPAVALPSVAYAQGRLMTEDLEAEAGTDATSQESPWSRGVTPAQQEAARKRFEEGNFYLKDSLFKLAAEKYRLALQDWNHPGIHFNLALALLNLDQPVAVHEHLNKALAYGAAPLDEEKVERAKSYLVLIEQQIAHVSVRSNDPGAVVRMDGQVLFIAPGKFEGWVRAGEHVWSASKPGFEITQKALVLKAKERAEITLRVYTEEELTMSQRRWSAWVPAVPIVAGTLLVGGGVTALLLSRNKMDQFEEGLASRCGLSSAQRSCPPTDELNELKDQASTYQNLAAAGFIGGGVTLATGIVLFSLNRRTNYLLTPEELEQQRREAARQSATVVPVLAPGTLGVVAAGTL